MEYYRTLKCSICDEPTNDWISVFNEDGVILDVIVCKQCAGGKGDWIELIKLPPQRFISITIHGKIDFIELEDILPKRIISTTIHKENCICFEDYDPDDDFGLPVNYEKLDNPDYCYEYREIFDLPENTIRKLDEIIKHSN